jgi:hypothetical protein
MLLISAILVRLRCKSVVGVYQARTLLNLYTRLRQLLDLGLKVPSASTAIPRKRPLKLQASTALACFGVVEWAEATDTVLYW